MPRQATKARTQRMWAQGPPYLRFPACMATAAATTSGTGGAGGACTGREWGGGGGGVGALVVGAGDGAGCNPAPEVALGGCVGQGERNSAPAAGWPPDLASAAGGPPDPAGYRPVRAAAAESDGGGGEVGFVTLEGARLGTCASSRGAFDGGLGRGRGGGGGGMGGGGGGGRRRLGGG